MMWIDVIIAVVVVLSAIIGFFRGFLREAFGLATWIAAFFLAFRYAPTVGPWLAQWIDVDSARIVVAFACVFVAVLIAGAILNYLLGRLISETGFAGTDRALGIVFGVVRGVAVLILLVLLAGVTSVPRDDWWQQSMFVGQLESGAVWVRGYLPANIAGAITYPDAPDTPAAAPAATVGTS
ncbi:CvpA family protein [Salinisphaera sp. Q1T1-3]|uniref:CvpA family protein n=1 Tax=Salinisphaera sp. Q1T1-3 TaxID=2321229 RepID=UPI000E76B3C6|nr:CvpA family protein [Salinisphaera sp. Q1T1-3]RJS95032.1 CvpA family protein [Salinisphaera sp. Q1T1-3]